jgi:large subunit ribosomal protein L24
MKLSVRKNDEVQVIAGRDSGKRGRVLRVLPDKGRVVVEGVNVIKRHTRADPRRQVKGGIVEREAAIHVSNVMLVDPDSSKPTRVGRKTLPAQGGERGQRVRVSRRSGTVLDK